MSNNLLHAWEGYPLDHQWGHKQINDRLQLQWSNRRHLLHQLTALTTAGLLQHHSGTRRNAVVGKWSLTPLGHAWLLANPLIPLPSLPAPAPNPQHPAVQAPPPPSLRPSPPPAPPPPLSPSPPRAPPAYSLPLVPTATAAGNGEEEEAASPRVPIYWQSDSEEEVEEEEEEGETDLCIKCGAQSPLITLTCGCPPSMCDRCFTTHLAQHKSKYGARAQYCCPVCNRPATRVR